MIPALRRYYIENKNAPFIEVAPCCTFDKWSFLPINFLASKAAVPANPVGIPLHSSLSPGVPTSIQVCYASREIIGLNGLFQISEATKLSV